jgi:mono/diheme cytochrome c family protein
MPCVVEYRLWIAILITINSCSFKDPKYQQYYAQGEQLYTKHCSNCHQKSGKGLGRLYPPLAQSDFLKNNFSDAICLMKNGIKDEVVVNTIVYNKPMPGVVALTDLEVAEIATYISNSWGNEHGLVDVSMTSTILSKCKP